MVNSKICMLTILLAFASFASAQQNVLYDFHMPSCAPCRRMDPTIQKLVAAGYPVRKVDITGSAEERSIARQFGITRVPSFVMVASGSEVARLTGPTSYEQLEKMLRLAQTEPPLTEPPGLPLAAQDSFPIANATRDADSWNLPATQTDATGSVYGEKGQSENPVAHNPFDAKLINASVRIRVGDERGHSWATGTVIDSRSGEALVITCGHVFRASQGKGQVLVDLFEALPSGLRKLTQVPGQVISYNLDRDIGLVGIRPAMSVRVAPIAGPGAAIQKFDAMTSIGCDHGANPTIGKTHIVSVDRYLGPSKIEVEGAPAEGRSGGGLFNSQGQLVGICNFADPQDNAGLYAALASIHAELDQIGLSEIYEQSQPIAAALSPLAAALGSSPQNQFEAEIEIPDVPSQLQPVRPAVHSQNTLLDDRSSQLAIQEGTSQLSMEEQAAYEEIMEHASEAEVVCIIRSKTPGGKSQVLTLGNVSGAFVRKLSSNRAAAALSNSAQPR